MATPGNIRPDSPSFESQTSNVVEFPTGIPSDAAAATSSAATAEPAWFFDSTAYHFSNPFTLPGNRQLRAQQTSTGERKPLWWALTDGLVVSLGALAVFAVRFWTPVAEHLWSWGEVEKFDPASIQKYLAFLLLYGVLTVLFCNMQHLYERRLTSAIYDFVAISKAVLQASLLLMSFLYLAHVNIISRLIVLCTAVVNIAALSGWRYAQQRHACNRLAKGKGARNVLIVGTDPTAQLLAKHLDTNPQFGFVVKGFAGPHQTSVCDRVLGSTDDVQRIARAGFIDDIFIATPSDRELVKRVALMARQMKINVQVLPELYDGLAWNAPVQYVGLFPLRVLHRQPIPASALLIKRLIDVLVSAFGLLILSPLLATVAAIVKLDSPGPVFYKSPRVGKKGRIFQCHKFRTMVKDADLLQSTLEHMNQRKGILFKIDGDPRVTNVGKTLRRFSLDELPQLWNVLIGDMSLVGPRPPVPREFKQYSLDHLRRLDVTPGLTGLWQVTARQDPSFENYISLDLQYVDNWSPLLDLKLLLRTVPVVLRGTGQ
jgi:exopolysaccharide biosynthesis polyprenyl glycosylphosphotransferase